LRYADDTVLLAENMSDLQNMLCLTFNVNKTKYIIVTKTEVPNEDLYVEGEKLERVESLLEDKCQLFCGLLFRNKDSH